jgi:hypothetical protein
MRHQPFEAEPRAGDRLLCRVAQGEPRDDWSAGHRGRRIERPGDADGIRRIGAAAPGETRHTTDEDECRLPRAESKGDQDAVLSPRFHAHVHCCCRVTAGGGNMW